MVYIHKDPTIEAGVLDLVLSERSRAADLSAWQAALGSYGYGLRRTDTGTVVTTLPHGLEVCRLPCGAAFGAMI